MSRRLMLLTALAGTLVAGVVAAPVQGARHHAKKRTITVGDDYFAPSKLTKRKHVKRGTRIVFHWGANSDTHDVKFFKTPKHVHHYHSPPATQDFRWARTLRRRGVYRFVCTFHPATMRGVIVVKR